MIFDKYSNQNRGMYYRDFYSWKIIVLNFFHVNLYRIIFAVYKHIGHKCNWLLKRKRNILEK